MGGGGGSTDINFRKPAKEWPTISQWYANQTDELNKYVQGQPLLQAATNGALDFWNQLPDTLSSLKQQFSGLPRQLQSQFGGLPAQLQNQFGALPQQLQHQFGRLPGQILGMNAPLTATMQSYLSPIIRSQGALTGQQERDVAQATRNIAQQQGDVGTTGALGQELLNRQSAQQQRYAEAMGQYQGAAGTVGGLDQLAQTLGTGLAQARQGLGTNLAQTVQGLGTNLAQVRQGLGTNLAQTTQGLQTGGLNQLTGVQNANVGTFSALTNPILSYLSNLFGGNLQGSIAQAQINQQGNIANQNFWGGIIGSVLSSIGSIAGGFSDERLKTKIRATGFQTMEGIPVKSWEYRTRPGVRYISPTAQDIEKKAPEAVLTEPLSGIKLIDVARFPILKVSATGGK